MAKNNTGDTFKEFCRLWLPEIELLDVSLNAGADRLAVFYSETGSRVPKELAWAGDGIQIWVQLLWHLFRAQGSVTIVLDEPEVYLHPDLQRRLVRLLDGTSAQIILASHSGDVIAEAPPGSVLWVDRRLGTACRAKSQQSLTHLSACLGSSYNLGVAPLLKTDFCSG
jgi:predicted ATPase